MSARQEGAGIDAHVSMERSAKEVRVRASRAGHVPGARLPQRKLTKLRLIFNVGTKHNACCHDRRSHLLTLIIGRLDRIEDRFMHIESRMDGEKRDASESRRRMHEKQESDGELLIKIDMRVEALEKSVEAAAPALKEWGETKQKTAVAGIFGRFLWKVFVALIGAVAFIFTVRHDISAWWHWLITQR